MDTLFWTGCAIATAPGLWVGWKLADVVRSQWSKKTMSKQLPMRTIDEQERMAGRPLRRSTGYVPAMPTQRAQLPAQTSTTYSIDAQPSSQLGSITHTSATDRARGYMMVQWPLAAVMGILVLAVAKSLADFPLLSFASFLVFWISFALVHLVGWGITLLLSAEGVAFYESKRKWDVVENEQAERWGHYNRQIETDAPPTPAPSPMRWHDGIDWPGLVLIVFGVWVMILITWVLLGGLGQ